MYRIDYLPPAEKYLRKLKDNSLRQKFLDQIHVIAEDPYNTGTQKKGDLVNIYCCDIYHKRCNYELAYTINDYEDGNLVVVIMCGTRENFYIELKNYLKKKR